MGCSTKQVPFIIASIALITGGILFFAFPVRNIFEKYINEGALVAVPVAATVLQGLLFLLACSTFFLSSFVDPGIYPREHTDDEDDFRQPLYKQVDINGLSIRMKWCETCRFYRPPRCSHCSICDNCVEKFDHHCPWVDNCIGKRNYKYFFLFVNTLTIFIITAYPWGALSIYLYKEEITKVIVEMILMVLGLIIVIPVAGLAIFHLGLVCAGRTTNEHVTGKFRDGYNPYNLGCQRNCMSIVCAPKFPRYMHYEMKYWTVNLTVREPSPERIEDHTIRMGCITEGIDQSEITVAKTSCASGSALLQNNRNGTLTSNDYTPHTQGNCEPDSEGPPPYTSAERLPCSQGDLQYSYELDV